MGLFGIEKKAFAQDAFDTIIGNRAKFKGELNAAGAIYVNGEFEGKLVSDGEIVIAEGSKIVGNVVGGSVIVSGQVDGDIKAAHSLEITKTGRVHGALVGGRIIIQEGSSYRGKVNVESKNQAEAEMIVETGEEPVLNVPADTETFQPSIF